MAAYGRFIPKNPEKYAGDPTKIFFRSSWEVRVMQYLDSSPAVMKWGSEELGIPYLKPHVDASGKPGLKPATYYPDFIVVYQDKYGNVQKEILEVKPLKESLAEKAKTDRDKMALAVNVMKWKAAEKFAQLHDMKFRVITEQSLFIQPPKKMAKKPVRATPARKAVKPRKSGSK